MVPNLFIIGAPKCGTTSLHNYLINYKEVGHGEHKEPHFFNDDQPDYRHATNQQQYLAFYGSDQDSRRRYALDSSTNYLYSETAVDNILRFNPNAKFIVMVRHPVDLVRSLHQHLLFRQIETEPNLEKAWALGPVRDRAPDFVKQFPYPGHTTYKNAGILGEHVVRVQQAVGIENLLVLFFSDLVKDPSSLANDVTKFLGIEYDPNVQFTKSNRAKSTRFSILNQLLFYPPPWLKKTKRFVKSIAGWIPGKKLDLYSAIGGKPSKSEAVSTDLRRQMIDYFRDDISVLSQATGRNLDDWLV